MLTDPAPLRWRADPADADDPLLFMGEPWQAQSPFLFFTDTRRRWTRRCVKGVAVSSLVSAPLPTPRARVFRTRTMRRPCRRRTPPPGDDPWSQHWLRCSGEFLGLRRRYLQPGLLQAASLARAC